jgi:probable rRNA maturation factor
MTQLNKAWLKRQGTTDVISFPLDEDKFPDKVLRLGDIVISYPQARKQAAAANTTVDEEVNKLVEHGVLSLLGLHHE